MGMLPIIVAGAAVVLLAGKKKKKSAPPSEEGMEPGEMPGMGIGGEGAPTFTIAARRVEPELLFAARAVPSVKKNPTKATKEAIEEQEEDEKKEEKKSPSKKKIVQCKMGTVSADKKKICWGDVTGVLTAGVPQRRKMRRVPKYSTVRKAAAAVAFTGGMVASPAMRFPQTRFMLYCWVKRKKIYRCTKRWKRGKKRCRRYARY